MTGIALGGAITFSPSMFAAPKSAVPAYLKGYEALYAKDPWEAALQYFRQAKFGLFMHYGLYSLLGRGEWVQLKEQIPVAEYAKLKLKWVSASVLNR